MDLHLPIITGCTLISVLDLIIKQLTSNKLCPQVEIFLRYFLIFLHTYVKLNEIKFNNLLVSAGQLCDLSVLFMRIQNLVTLFGLSLSKDLNLVISLNLIILHDEKRCAFHEKHEKHNAFHTEDYLQGIVTLCL